MRILIAPLLALASLGASSGAPALAATVQGCNRCHGHGTLPCTKHPKDAAKLESTVTFCSIAARCTACKGTLLLDCPDCHGKEEEEYLEKVAQQERRIQEELQFEKYFPTAEPRGRALTKHFELVFEVDHMTVGRDTLDQHALLHLYMDRMEKLFSMTNDLIGVKEGEHVCKRYMVMVWKNPLDNRDAQTRFTEGGQGGAGSKLLGARGVYTTVYDKSKTPQDDDLHRNLVHNVAHLFLASLWDGVWIGQYKSAWVDEGFAHWFEDKIFGQCTNFCYQEQNNNVSFRSGKWRVPVRGMADDPKRTPFSETSNKAINELTPAEHALSFSYVDYLLTLDPKKFPAFVKVLKKKKPTRDALTAGYELTVFQFEEQWKKFVLETYQKR